MNSCYHYDRDDGGTTSGGETLNKIHNNQRLNPNVVAVAHNSLRIVRRPLDAPLLGSDIIHDPKDKIQCHNTWTGSGSSTYFGNFARLIFELDMRPIPLER
jgi:hypothetical protein